MARPLSVLLAVLALLGAGCGEADSTARPAESDPPQPSFDRAGWRTDFSRRATALEEIHIGGPPKDGIPPIDRPRGLPQRVVERLLSEREPVVVVETGGRARAYPLRVLVWHEVVNDRIAGRPVAVTYSPLTSSVRVWDRRVRGREVRFGTTGNLRASNGVLWDRRTESWWQQLTGRAIVGALSGERLAPVAAQTLSWARYKATFPRGDVLARPPGGARDYGTNPYLGYDEPMSRPHLFRGRLDRRLAPKERVVALGEGVDAVAVPFSQLARRPVSELEVAGVPVVVLFDRDVASAIDDDAVAKSKSVGAAGAFDRRARGRLLSFEARGGGGFRDRETGSRWDVTGRALSGPLRGARLRRLASTEPFWFALAALEPRVRVRVPPGSPAPAAATAKPRAPLALSHRLPRSALPAPSAPASPPAPRSGG